MHKIMKKGFSLAVVLSMLLSLNGMVSPILAAEEENVDETAETTPETDQNEVSEEIEESITEETTSDVQDENKYETNTQEESNNEEIDILNETTEENVFDIGTSPIIVNGDSVIFNEETHQVSNPIITGTSDVNTIILNGGTVTLRDLNLTQSSGDPAIDIQSGSVVLRLEGTNTISNPAGGDKAVVHVSESASLSAEGNGSLTIMNGSQDGVSEAHGAGIGGNLEEAPGSITINNGTINITQYGTSAAIGGGARADSGAISITGGNVAVDVHPAGGDLESAGTGIGGGGENIKDNSLIGSAGNADISITGGNVSAFTESTEFSMGAISSGAAIGSGENKGGKIYIAGNANVIAEAYNLASAIGSSNATWGEIGDSVDPAPTNPMNITIEGSAVVKATTHSLDFYGQGAYAGAAIGMSVQNLQPCTITIGGSANVTANSGWYGAGIGGGYVQIEEQAQPMTINIKDSATVKASAEVYGAGIGSGYGDSGAESATINISGNPTIEANGGWGGAGIGGAKGTKGGSINISGGNITATGDVGGSNIYEPIGGAGIGAGAVDDSDGLGGSAGEINITGGTIKAYGSVGSAGIGGGNIKAIMTSGEPSLEPNEKDNGGGAESISISGNANILAVGGAGASAIGIGATYEDENTAIPFVKELKIGEGVSIEAYADGALYAIDGAQSLPVSHSLLNARFEEGANPTDQSKSFNVYEDGKEVRTMTMPANYRSFATTISNDNDHDVTLLEDGVEIPRYAYYPEKDLNDNDIKQIHYPMKKSEILEKDNLNWTELATIDPADVVVYMGGEDGYEGIVDENGAIQNSNSLPEPGFYITIPDEVNDVLKEEEGLDPEADDVYLDLTKYITLSSGDKSWHLEYYGEDGASYSSEHKNVYKLVAAEGQDPVRIQITDSDGNVYISDEFDMASALYNDYTINLYAGNTILNNVVMNVKGYGALPFTLDSGTLKVRGLTENAKTEPVKNTISDEVETPTAVIPEDAVYTINDGNVKVTDVSGVHLLSDEIIDTKGTKDLLKQKVNEVLSINGEGHQYQMTYLDLVDVNNGNVWVKSDKPISVYLPYPEGTDENTEFNLVHFEGLHREMRTEEVADQIAQCNATSVEITNTEYGIKFETNSFSPFVLTWTVPTSVVNEVPVINAADKTINVGDEFDPMKDVTASDKEDGVITDKVTVINNTVDTKKPGTYKVTYQVTDSQGAAITKTIKITVKAVNTGESGNSEDNPTDDSKKQDSADTGLMTNTGLYVSLMVSAGLLVAVLVVIKKMRKHSA